MKKILIIEASGRKGFSSSVTDRIQGSIQEHAQVDRVILRDLTIRRCLGCCACFSMGDDRCPLKDDDVLDILKKLEESDGVIFVVPNYSLSVPGILKDVLDRLAFVFHRPRLFGRVCMPVIVQGVYGGNKVAKYINEVMGFWGMNEIKGVVLSGGIDPRQGWAEEIQAKNAQTMDKAVQRFLAALDRKEMVVPSLFKLMIFRMTRSSMSYFPEALDPDKAYYETHGWLTSDYYYPVRLNPFKRALGGYG